jgi:predicted metal-dependent phosphoesterase TrpH
MPQNILAHPANKKVSLQTLIEHLRNVAGMASEFAKSFHSENWVYNTVYYII